VSSEGFEEIVSIMFKGNGGGDVDSSDETTIEMMIHLGVGNC
jgi:hypothetical protein